MGRIFEKRKEVDLPKNRSQKNQSSIPMYGNNLYMAAKNGVPGNTEANPIFTLRKPPVEEPTRKRRSPMLDEKAIQKAALATGGEDFQARAFMRGWSRRSLLIVNCLDR